MTRRLQILVDDEQFDRLEQLARERNTTVAALVRAALDHTYPPHALPRDVAADRFLARPPRELGSWEDAKEEIEVDLQRGLAR